MFRYLIYRTDFNNTIVRESQVDDPGANEGSLWTDFVIPKIQPLYLWRVDGTDVVPNDDEDIRAWLDEIAPPPSPDDLVTYHQLTGITETKIDKLTGATDNIAIFAADGNLQDGGYTIPELTGLTTYTFVGSGGTEVFVDGNEITIKSQVPTGTTVLWGDILGDIEDQTDLQDALDEKLDVTEFETYTGETETRLQGIEGEITGLTATKLDITDFNTYTGDSQPILDAALTGVTNVGTGVEIGDIDLERNVVLKTLVGQGNVTITLDGDDILISGETGIVEVNWGDILGDIENQTDLINYITGITSTKLEITDFETYTGATDIRLEGIEDRLGDVEDDIVTLSGLTEGKLDLTDFESYTGATDTRIEGVEDRLDDVEDELALTLTGATNGLTVDGRNVELGGELTKDTTISGTTHDLTINVQDITLQSTGQISLLDVDGNGINVESDGGIINLVGNDNVGSEEVKISISESGIIVTDSRDTKTGVEYADNYATDFVDRSLVDKGYVDAVATGLHPKTGVLVATTEDIALSGLTMVDGVQLSDGDRVLVKDQLSGETNGIYIASADEWERSPDFDGNPQGEVSQGDMIPVISGNTYFNTIWVLVTPNPIIVGTTELEFTKFSSPISLQEGVGISILGQTISVDGASLAGNSIVWTGNTFNVDVESGTLATALGEKLDVTVFDGYTGDTEARIFHMETTFDAYTGDTETRLQGIEGDITGLTATKLDISEFEAYTGETETRLLGIEGDIEDLQDDVAYISGVTDTKLDTDVFTGYTATTAPNELFLVHTGGTNLNTVLVTELVWDEAIVEGSLYEWNGSEITVLETGLYEISYNVPFNVDRNSQIIVGGNVVLNDAVLNVTASAGMANRTNAAGSVNLATVIVSLEENDEIALALFRTGQAGEAISAPSASISIKRKNTLQ